MLKLRATRHKVLPKVAGVALVVSMVAVPVVSATPAHGDPIGDIQSRAREVTQQIADLQGEIRAATSAVERARYRSSQLNSEIAAKRKRLKVARSEESSARGELRTFAMQAYMSGGTKSGLTDFLDTDGDKLGQRSGYVSIAVGDRRQLADDLNAAQRVTREQRLALEAAQHEADSTRRKAEAEQRQAQQAADHLAAIKDQLDGRLKTLVAERQAAQARAEQERVKAQIAAQAAAAARKERAAAPARPEPATITPPVTTGNPRPTTPPRPSAPRLHRRPPDLRRLQTLRLHRSRSLQPALRSACRTHGEAGTRAGPALRHRPRREHHGLRLLRVDAVRVRPSRHITVAPDLGPDETGTSRAGLPDRTRRPRVLFRREPHGPLHWGRTDHPRPQTGDFVKYGSLYLGTPELVVRPPADPNVTTRGERMSGGN